ncbi:MAG: hypothetical protein EXR91_03135 [Gemmatimonadetes bacterium]|nr:hypothetical protein [Gemmatimonadota bacterium]
MNDVAHPYEYWFTYPVPVDVLVLNVTSTFCGEFGYSWIDDCTEHWIPCVPSHQRLNVSGSSNSSAAYVIENDAVCPLVFTYLVPLDSSSGVMVTE